MLFFYKKGKSITYKKTFFTFILLCNTLSLTALQNVSIIGTGYVGLVTGTCLAEIHNLEDYTITCLDIDTHKIKQLNNGIIPIFEPGLQELVQKNMARNALSFSHDIANTVSQSNIIFIAVGTPTNSDGSVDVSYFYNALETVIKNATCNPTTIVLKSTLPIGTGEKAVDYINQYGNKNITYYVVSNPEFLREGTAIFDTMNPDRIVIGSSSDKALPIIHALYQPFITNNIPFLHTNLTTAETVKYAANSFLAIKLSYINEIANLCDKTGANIKDVSKGIGYDKRIGSTFLNPGPGFGGSCLPKDTLGLLATAKELNVALNTVTAAVSTNQRQKLMPYKKLKQYIQSDALNNKTVAILGLAFKANTDDIRYSPAIPVIEKLLEKNVTIQAYDPQAMQEMKKLFPSLTYCNTVDTAVTNADAVIVITDWPEFKSLDMNNVKQLMRGNCIIDARNILDQKTMHELGFQYAGIGIPSLS